MTTEATQAPIDWQDIVLRFPTIAGHIYEIVASGKTLEYAIFRAQKHQIPGFRDNGHESREMSYAPDAFDSVRDDTIDVLGQICEVESEARHETIIGRYTEACPLFGQVIRGLGDGLNQQEIAQRIGTYPMAVSRLVHEYIG